MGHFSKLLNNIVLLEPPQEATQWIMSGLASLKRSFSDFILTSCKQDSLFNLSLTIAVASKSVYRMVRMLLYTGRRVRGEKAAREA